MDNFRRTSAFCCLIALLPVVIGACRKSPDNPASDELNAILFPFRLTTPLEANKPFHATSLFVDSRENKWITFNDGSGNNGIIRFDGNSGDSYPNVSTPLPLYTGGFVTAHTEDSEGGVYFTSTAGNFSHFRLFRYKDGTWSSWEVSGIPCREVYYNRNDNKLYFVFLDQIHGISPTEDFSQIENYQQVNLESNGSPAFTQSAFDGANFHMISADRYFVFDSTGYAVFYTPKFNDVVLSYIYASTPEVVYTIGGSSHNQIFKLHEGRWARFPIAATNLKNISVDQDEQIYVNVLNPVNNIGKYIDGNISYFTYGSERKILISETPVVIDSRNVKWAVVAEGIVRLP